MTRRPPSSTRTPTLFPSTTRFRSKRRRDAREELLPRLGHRDTARRPVDEPQVQALLQCPQLMAERRWRDAKLVGGASKALMPGDRQEGRKIGRVNVWH